MPQQQCLLACKQASMVYSPALGLVKAGKAMVVDSSLGTTAAGRAFHL